MSIFFYSILFLCLSFFDGQGAAFSNSGVQVKNFWELCYFSFITATSTGYGDIVPIGAGRLVASLEAFTGLLLFATFISKLLSRRQDVTLGEMHRLAFRTEFHNVREDFYVARKDLDRAIVDMHASHAISDEKWEELSVAFQQIGRLLQEVPEFYESGNDLYIIDSHHERLLHEAVRRTLIRVAVFCADSRTELIAWNSEVLNELTSMITQADLLMGIWRDKSTQQKAFEDVGVVIEKIRSSAAAADNANLTT